uniref:nSTAND1 domain-containing NTPase n=1 Tax=Brasilonema sp. UFV-L1 TaxID=2234130 RepID=UPI00145F7172|nr:hypothetical protein [Brasilonema sp. UFV-L1]
MSYRLQEFGASSAIARFLSPQTINSSSTLKISERTVNNSGHSPFAMALIQGLSEQLEGEKTLVADLSKDGVITAPELYIHLRDSVEKWSNEFQTPGLWPLPQHDRGEFIFTKPNFNPNQLTPAPELDENNNPYRGLKPYDEEHARFFFGRQEVIQQLSVWVSQPGHQLTAVVGISGSGKSSLVKAGLIPYLRKNKEWQILEPMRPGEYPFAALARTILAIANEAFTTEIEQINFLNTACQEKAEQFESLATIWNNVSLDKKLLLLIDRFEELKTACCNSNEEQQLEKLKNTVQDSLKNLIASLQTERQELINIVTSWSQAHPNVKLLLIIDQFEELITLSHNSKEDNNQEDKKEWQQFLNLLAQTLKSCPHLCLVLTLRSDFETRFIGSPLNAYWVKARFPVRPMRSDELRQAIVGPASEMALYFEPPNLVDRLIDEIGQMPGALPLLSFTLSELYIKLYNQSKGQEKPQRTLTIDENFERQGGVAGSITSRANAEYALLANDAERTTMQRVMLRMLTIEGWEASRRQVPDSELVYPNLEENQRVTKVIEHLVQARLVVKGRETGEPYVEPAHDFLVRGWDMLQDWIKENRDDLMLQQRLTPAANDWDHNGRRRDLLWSDGDRLRQLEKISASPYNWLNRRETDFIESSIQQVKEHQARENLLNEAKKISDVIQNEPFDALIRSIKAVGQNLEQLPNQVLDRVQFNLHTAMEMARESNILQGHKDSVSSVAVSPDGKMIVTGSHDKTVRLWDIQGNPIGQPFQGHAHWVSSVVISPDGKMIVTGSGDKTVRLWDTQGNPIGQPFRGHNLGVSSVAISPDGLLIISSSQDKTVRLWDIQGNPIGQPFQGHAHWVSSVVISPDGKMIVTGSGDKTVRLWDTQGNPIGQPFRGHNLGVSSVAISPDGLLIISSSQDKTVRLWDIQGNPIGQPFQGHDGWVRSVAISQDGKMIVTGSDDKTVRLWDINGNPIGQPLQHEDVVTSVAFRWDGQMIVSGNQDNKVWLWDIKGNRIGQPFQGHTLFYVNSVAFSPDGQMIASGGDDETVRLWDINGNLIRKLVRKHNSTVNSVVFSPNGQKIISGHSDHTVCLWDVQFHPVGQPLQGHNSTVNSVAVSSDGQLIVSASRDKTVRLWNIQGNLIRKLSQENNSNVSSVAFSPDGQLIVSAHWDDKVRLWDIQGNLIRRQYGSVKAESFWENVKFGS